MISWVELNKDGLLTSLIIAIIMLPVAEIFTRIMNKKRDNKKGNKNNYPSKNKKTTKQQNPSINREKDEEKIVNTKVEVIYIEKTSNNSTNELGFEVVIILLIILTAATSFFYKYEEVISNLIYVVGCFGFWINITMFAKEIKRVGEKTLTKLMAWTSFLWIYIIFSMHLLYHPIYTFDGALIAKQAVKTGQSILTGGIQGLAYLLYQFLGIVFLVVIILIVISTQIYSLAVWWNESRKVVIKNKLIAKVFDFFNCIFFTGYKFIVISTIIVIISFVFESGILAKITF